MRNIGRFTTSHKVHGIVRYFFLSSFSYWAVRLNWVELWETKQRTMVCSILKVNGTRKIYIFYTAQQTHTRQMLGCACQCCVKRAKRVRYTYRYIWIWKLSSKCGTGITPAAATVTAAMRFVVTTVHGKTSKPTKLNRTTDNVIESRHFCSQYLISMTSEQGCAVATNVSYACVLWRLKRLD